MARGAVGAVVCLLAAGALLSAWAQEEPGSATYTQEQIKSIPAETFLVRMLNPEPGYQQFAAMSALAQKAKESEPAAVEGILSLVIEAMQDTSRPVYQRYQCCYVLSGCGDEQAAPDLIEVMQRDANATMRGVAAEALADFWTQQKSAAAHEALLQAAQKETDPTVREVFTRRLGIAGPAAPAPAPAPVPAPAAASAVEELAPTGPPQPPPARKAPVTTPLPWPFSGGQEQQEIFNNYQQATDAYIHSGLDFIHPAGTPVKAVASGYVALIFTNYPQWKTHHFFIVTPEEGGDEGWCYTHLDPDTFSFAVGDPIRQGQQLGKLVDFSVGKLPGVAHLHLHYVRFTRDASGRVEVHSLLDPLYYFDWKDTEAPVFQPLRFVSHRTLRAFEADPAGVVTVSGKVDLLAALTDSAFPGHLGNLGVPVVMLSISDGRHTVQNLVVDHRGDVGEEKRVKPLYLSYDEKRQFFDPDAFPRYQMLRVTATDGDGQIEWRDTTECWDTAATGPTGRHLWPNGEYHVNVYAWDIAGNRAVVGAVVKVKNR